jgi:hypothetical protein
LWVTLLFVFDFTSLILLPFISMTCGPIIDNIPISRTWSIPVVTTIRYHYSYQDFLDDDFADEFNPHPSIAHLYWIAVHNPNSKQQTLWNKQTHLWPILSQHVSHGKVKPMTFLVPLLWIISCPTKPLVIHQQTGPIPTFTSWTISSSKHPNQRF